MTFFTQTNDNQYQFTKQLYLEGHEVALHSVRHNTNVDSTKSTWEREIVKAREYIAKYCLIRTVSWLVAGIPEEDIVGFRAPDLKYNDVMFSVLQERGFLYDSSIPYDVTSSDFYFPYTLDFGAQEQQWKSKYVTTPHPGLWEFALPTLLDENKQIVTIQDPSGSKEEIIQLLKDNFGTIRWNCIVDLHYNHDRAPFVIGLTASWLLQDETARLEVLEVLTFWSFDCRQYCPISVQSRMLYSLQLQRLSTTSNHLFHTRRWELRIIHASNQLKRMHSNCIQW